MFLVQFIFFFFSTAAAYSVHYYAPSGNAGVVGDDMEFSRAPSAMQVADIYARLGGHAPLLKEDIVSLPAVDILHKSKIQPVLLNVVGEAIPNDLTPIVHAQRGPSAQKVSDALASNGINVELKEMTNVKESDIRAYLAQQERPVVVVFNDISAAPVTRRLQSDLNGTTPLTEYEISSYQIFYWVEFAVILLLLSGVFAIVGMDVIPDSLLFAKFQSSRTNKID